MALSLALRLVAALLIDKSDFHFVVHAAIESAGLLEQLHGAPKFWFCVRASGLNKIGFLCCLIDLTGHFQSVKRDFPHPGEPTWGISLTMMGMHVSLLLTS